MNHHESLESGDEGCHYGAMDSAECYIHPKRQSRSLTLYFIHTKYHPVGTCIYIYYILNIYIYTYNNYGVSLHVLRLQQVMRQPRWQVARLAAPTQTS